MDSDLPPEANKHTSKLANLFEEYLAVELEAAEKVGGVGFMARALVLATLPHSRPKGNTFLRENGAFSLAIMAHPKAGLPYGSIPRLLLCWVTTETIRTKSRTLILGSSLSQFMRKLGLAPTGGRWGSITRIKTQMERLFSCTISCRYGDGSSTILQNVTPVSKAYLWWDPRSPAQASLWESYIILTEEFAREIQDRPVPFSLFALKFLRQSPMALDIYLWATYRNSYSTKTSRIPWEALQMQFGAGYPPTTVGKRNFKQFFLRALNRVKAVYPEARKLYPEEGVLVFPPGKPSIHKLPPRE